MKGETKTITTTNSADYKIMNVIVQRSLFWENDYLVQFYYQAFDQIKMHKRWLKAKDDYELKERVCEIKAEIFNTLKDG